MNHFSSYQEEFMENRNMEDSDESYQSSDDETRDHSEEEDNDRWVDDAFLDEIADWEDTIPYHECIPNQYYIGTYKYLEMQDILLFARKIHISTFYKYSKKQLSEYLYWFSGMYISSNPHLEILQVKVDPQGVYSCIIKTFWLRIIQRRWKAVFRKEKLYIKQNILSIIRKRERTGKPNFMPKLRGLLL
jgi:hypothetical protein